MCEPCEKGHGGFLIPSPWRPQSGFPRAAISCGVRRVLPVCSDGAGGPLLPSHLSLPPPPPRDRVQREAHVRLSCEQFLVCSYIILLKSHSNPFHLLGAEMEAKIYRLPRGTSDGQGAASEAGCGL